MKLVNTSQRKFLSQSPITILNKTAPCGAMRPIAYFAVEIPRTGSHLSAAPLKETFTYEGKDGNVKAYSKNQSSPCGDSFTPSVGFGILEVPLHSVHDPNNVVADQHHNIDHWHSVHNSADTVHLANQWARTNRARISVFAAAIGSGCRQHFGRGQHNV